nr:hypothetical protein [Patescibacteria group bacterium]
MNSDLNEDLKIIKLAIEQENRDIQAASTISSLKPDSLSVQPQSLSNWLNLAQRELSVSEFLNQSSKSQLALELSRLQAAITPYKTKQVSLNHQKIFVTQFQNLLPKIAEIKVFDDQQIAENLLTQLSGILNRAIIRVGVKGVVATDDQADLTTLISDAGSGAKLSAASENELAANKVMSSGLKANLTAAKLDINAALNAAETINGRL